MNESNSNRFRESLTIWPHRSLSPRGFALVMAALGSLAFCIGLGFFLLGSWPVIGFLGLEILVVWGAFKLNYRAAKRRQHLTATTKKLKIENVSPEGDRETTEMPTAWVQVELTPRDEPEMRSRQRRKIIAFPAFIGKNGACGGPIVLHVGNHGWAHGEKSTNSFGRYDWIY